jgi:hypothetical protein
MADITYTIGAKDAASPVLDKVEGSLGRLERSTKDLGDNAEKSFKRMAIGVDGLLKASGILFVIDKSVQAIGAAFSFVAGGVSDFNNAEAVANKLTEAMKANGEASQEMIDANIALSDALEKRLNIEAESIQSLMSEAANLGVANDKLDDVTRAAIGLSEAMGISLEDGLKKARLASEGNFASFEKLIPSIKNMTTDEEKLAAVIELSNKGLAQKESHAQGAAGAGERLATKIGDLAEVIGGALSPMIETATVAFEAITDTMISVLSPALDATGGAFGTFSEWVQQKMTDAANGIIAAITMAEVVVMNFGDVWQLVKDTIALRLEQIGADFEYLFGTIMPSYGDWLLTNLPRMFDDALTASVTVVQNGIKKITGSFDAAWQFIKSGGEGGLSGLTDSLNKAVSGSLLKGFESTTEALPQILARGLTDKEQELSAAIGATANKLGDEFNKKFEGRRIGGSKDIAKGLADSVELELTKGIETAVDKAAKDAGLDKSGSDKPGSTGGGLVGPVNAIEGRLITTGSGSTPFQLWQQIASNTEDAANSAKRSEHAMLAMQSDIAELKNREIQKPTLNVARPPA